MKINKKNFTTDVIAKAQCDPGKNQAIFYDAKTPGLGLRVTGAGVKSFIFETRLNGKTLRRPLWSELHIRDHEKIIQAGGAPRIRSKKLTEPGSLAALSTIRLVDLTPELVTEWAKVEAVTRPPRARLALRLLRAFLNWCSSIQRIKPL